MVCRARDGWGECDSGLIYECRQRNQSAVCIWTTLKPRFPGWGHKCTANCLERQRRLRSSLISKWTVTQQHSWWCFEWWCFVQISAKEGLSLRVCISRCTGGGGTHRGPLPGRFLRWPEKGRNQVRLFLRPNQRITTKKDMCSAPPPLYPPYSIRPAWLDTGSQ